jgi:hypothetical protein
MPFWKDNVEEVASTILARSPISIWEVEYTAMTLAVEQPEVALRLVRAKFNFLLAKVTNESSQPRTGKDRDNDGIISSQPYKGEVENLKVYSTPRNGAIYPH